MNINNNNNNNNNFNNAFKRGYRSLNRRAISDIGSFYSILDSTNETDNEDNVGIFKAYNR
jgi:hypothetical protein